MRPAPSGQRHVPVPAPVADRIRPIARSLEATDLLKPNIVYTGGLLVLWLVPWLIVRTQTY